MKTLRKTAEEAYLKYANKIINRETWIDGFISGIQYKKEYPQSIELCGHAAGLCDISSGEVTTTRSYGFYWASSLCGKSNDYASSLYFNAGVVDPLNGGSYSSGFSVRCVQNK